MLRRFIRFLFYPVIFLAFLSITFAQCPQLLDGQGNFVNNPYWISCTGGNFSLFLQPDIAVGNYTIDWGDGTPNDNGTSIIPPAFITHVYAATADTFIVTLTDHTNSCVVTGVVVMEQVPTASIVIPFGDPVNGCAPAAFNFNNNTQNVSPTTRFTWDFGDGSPILNFDFTNSGQTISHTYLPGTVNCDVAVTLTAENYCNQGNPSTNTFFPIQVWDIDDADITASNDLLCYPDTTVDFTNTTNRNCFANGNTAQRYEWWNFGDYWGQGSDSIIGWRPWGPPNNPPITMAYPGIGTYNVMLVDSSFCGLDTTFQVIQIVPPPTAGLSISMDTICEGESVNFGNLSGGGANSFFWNYGDGSGWVASGGGGTSHTYNTTGDYVIQLAAFITGGTANCTDTATISLHVLPSPVADFNFDNNNGCDSLTVTYTDMSTVGANSWTWDFDNGNSSNLPNPPPQFYGSPGTYNIQLDVGSSNGCTNSTSQTINVFQSPVPLFTPTSVCQNVTSLFTDQSTSSMGDPIINWSWDFGDGNTSMQQNPTHLYTVSGSLNIILSVSTAFCSASDTVPVTVETAPTANFTPSTFNGCSPLGINFANNSSANAVSFMWDFGDGNTSTATNPNHTYINNFGVDTSYTVTLISQTTFGCSDTVSQVITVYPNPNASFTHDAVLDCAPQIVNFTNSTSGATSYSWDFGDGSPIDNSVHPTHTYQNGTQFIDNNVVTLIAMSTNGCTDTVVDSILVFPEPQFGFSASPDSGCSPLAVLFPSVVGAVLYEWDFGDGNTGTGPTPTHTYINSTTNNQTHTVRLIATSSFGCVDTTYGSVVVFPNPSAQFTIDSTSGCHPFPINITNLSTGGVLHHWDMGDGNSFDTSLANFSYTFMNTTGAQQTYVVELIAETSEGCMDTSVQNVDVYPDITAAYISDTVGCSPLNVNFTNISIGGANYYWDFGDGSPLDSTEHPSHQYVNTTLSNVTHTVTLIIESAFGCFDTTFGQVLVYPEVTSQFSLSAAVGCHPFPINITNTSTGGALYHWDMGDGSSFDTSSLNFSYTYINTTGSQQTYSMELVAENSEGCLDTSVQNVDIYPDITAAYISDTAGCSPLNVDFTNISIGGVNYYWDFGDGSPLDSTQHPSHQYINSTLSNVTHTVTLIIESTFGCFDTTYGQVLVYPEVTSQFNLSTAVGCHPLPVTYTNTTIGGSIFHWDLGDGTAFDTSSLSFNHTYTNLTGITQSHTVTLIGENIQGCRDTSSIGVVVYPDVIASFTSDSVGCSPLDVNFINGSTGAVNYYWDFGDGSPLDSTQQPSHQYINTTLLDISHTVTLIAESAFGCRDTVTRQVLVFPEVTSQFSVDTAVGCHPLSVNYTNTTIGGNFYHWDLGDGAVFDTSALNFGHVFTNFTGSTQTYRSILVAENTFGCFDTSFVDITVYPNIIAAFTANTSGCSPLDVNFLNASTGEDKYYWDFGDGSPIDTTQNPNHQFVNTTPNDIMFNVTLIVESSFGCFDTTQQVITVYATPVASFTPTPITQTYPSSTVFITNTSSPGTWQYDWDFGDTTTSTLQNPLDHTYSTWGVYQISLVVTGANCSDSVTETITIIPPIPIANFSGPAQGCRPLTVQFTNTSMYADSYDWDFGDGGISTQFEPSYTYYTAGNYTVTLRVVGPGGMDTLTQQFIIEVYELPNAFFTVSPTTVFIPNDPASFHNLSVTASSYSWDFGDGNTSTEVSPQHFYTEPGVYDITLIASTPNNCRDTFLLATGVEAMLEGGISVPNAFTPSTSGPNGGTFSFGDTDNDVFHPIIIGADEYELNIFNKWGELLFISNDVNIGWDGYYRGELSKQDVYIYKIKVKYLDGRFESLVGDLTLLR